jgi:hypothetical protein
MRLEKPENMLHTLGLTQIAKIVGLDADAGEHIAEAMRKSIALIESRFRNLRPVISATAGAARVAPSSGPQAGEARLSRDRVQQVAVHTSSRTREAL